MNVKICGITNKEDAMMALNAGSDALGVIVNVPVETPRKISVERACEIRDSVDGISHAFITVLMPKNLNDVEKVVSMVRPDGIQLHGLETPNLIKEIKDEFGLPIIKALHLGGEMDMDYVQSVSEHSDMLLLDTKKDYHVGGTGETHDIEQDLQIKKSTSKRILLSGGLNPDNVFERICQVNPYGVDISSGVEKTPGIKDHEKVRKIIEVCSCL